MDYNKIHEAAKGYEADMTKFLRDLVRIPGESAGEKGHIMRIKEEMEKVGFDKVEIDPMGNILGYMGSGKTLIGYDAHIDTVGIGNGSLIPTKVLNLSQRLADEELLTRWEASYLLFTVQRS